MKIKKKKKRKVDPKWVAMDKKRTQDAIKDYYKYNPIQQKITVEELKEELYESEDD